MNDTSGPELSLPRTSSTRPGARLTGILWIVVPLSLFALAAVWLVAADPLRAFNNGAPPVECLDARPPWRPRRLSGPEGERLDRAA